MITELTKEQRHEIYLTALNYFWFDYKLNALNGKGLCWYMHDAIIKTLPLMTDENRCDFNPYYNYFKAFPEILSERPYTIYSEYWFPVNAEGNQKRIEILRKAVILTQ